MNECLHSSQHFKAFIAIERLRMGLIKFVLWLAILQLLRTLVMMPAGCLIRRYVLSLLWSSPRSLLLGTLRSVIRAPCLARHGLASLARLPCTVVIRLLLLDCQIRTRHGAELSERALPDTGD